MKLYNWYTVAHPYYKTIYRLVVSNKEDEWDTCIPRYKPNRKGGHRHNHVRNATSRMHRCNICDKPITKYEGFSMRFYGHICMECRKLDVEEYCQAVGLNLSPSAFSFLRNPYIRRKRR